MFTLLRSPGAHKPTALAPTMNSSTGGQPRRSIVTPFQSNPMKRKRDNGGDTTWLADKIPDTHHMEPAGSSASPSEPNGQGDEMRHENAGSFELPAVSSLNIATKNESKKLRGGIMGHDDPVLGDLVSLDTLRQNIDYQFSLEVLLKHRELRLIDQEIAKCQIALEQLRRCQVIPYPAMSSDLDDMQAVASGSGPSLESTVPHPSPWGITDGPYARHYARWLLPDAAFDPNVVDSNSFQAGKIGSERTTRGSVSDKSYGAASSRTYRGSSSARLQAHSHGYPEPREEKGPLILKRSADGRMVKLVCTDCRRENFNSAQGFINHCRIAHNRGYVSHEAAALACGVEVEHHNGDASGVMESPAATSAKAGGVHPLIGSPTKAPSVPWNLPSPSSRQKDLPAAKGEVGGSVKSPTIAADPLSTSITGRLSDSSHQNISSSFTPSPQTPHLSARFAKIGRGGDLNQMVDQAKTRVDTAQLDQLSEDDNYEGEEEVPQTPFSPSSLSTRGVIGGASLSRRPGAFPATLERTPSNQSTPLSRRSKPSPNNSPSIPYDSPYADARAPFPPLQEQQADTQMIDASPTLNLSPNTIESQPAPSLISDDDGDEYESAHSESESPSSEEDNQDGDHYLDFEVEDHGEEMDDLRGSDSPNLGLTANVKPHSPGARRSSALRSPTTIRPGPSIRHERHVSFASPGDHSPNRLPKAQKRKDGK